MADHYPLRRLALWGGKLALLAVSGCAAPASSTRQPLTELYPTYPTTETVETHQRSVTNPSRGSRIASVPRRTSAEPRRQPPAHNNSYVSAPRQGTELDLQRQVIRFTRRPDDLISPPVPVRRWQYIVLHHSGEQNGGFASIDAFHRGPERGWDECGYHFVIGNGSESGDGEIEVGGRWLKQKHGAHTHPPGHTEYNEEGLGICLVGDCNQAPPTPRQVEACRRLVAYLQARCGVPSNGVITHGDAEGANTDCPGQYFPYNRLVPRPGFASR